MSSRFLRYSKVLKKWILHFFKIASSTNLRGHSFKLYMHNLRLDTRKYLFSQRVIDMIFLLIRMENIRNNV